MLAIYSVWTSVITNKYATINVGNIPCEIFFRGAVLYFQKYNIECWILFTPLLSSMEGLYRQDMLTQMAEFCPVRICQFKYRVKQKNITNNAGYLFFTGEFNVMKKIPSNSDINVGNFIMLFLNIVVRKIKYNVFYIIHLYIRIQNC